MHKQSGFLSPVSHPSKLLNLRRGLWEPATYGWLVRTTDDLVLATKVTAVLWDQALKPVESNSR